MSTATKQDYKKAYLATRTDINPETGCWEWKGYKSLDGVGRFTLGGVSYSPHKLAYEVYVGPIPDGKKVATTCQTPGCANFMHTVLVPHGTKRPQVTSKKKVGKRLILEDGLYETCRNGHYYTTKNTTRRNDGSRRCDQCRAKNHNDSVLRQRGEALKVQADGPGDPVPAQSEPTPQPAPAPSPTVIKRDYDGRPIRPSSFFQIRRLNSRRLAS